MRIDVKKFLFFGLEKEKKAFFQSAQKLGLIQFVEKRSSRRVDIPDSMAELERAIKILRTEPPQESKNGSEDPLTIAKEIIGLQQEIDQMIDQEKLLSLEIVRVFPLGTFSMEEVREIEEKTARFFQFFCAKKREKEIPDSLIFLSEDDVFKYFLSIDREKKSFPKMIEMKIEASRGDLLRNKETLVEKRQAIQKQLREMACYSETLHRASIEAQNHYHLSAAEHSTETPLQATFMGQGWVPENKIDKVQSLAGRFHVVMEEIAPETSEVVPTYLENRNLGSIGEDLVSVFDTPSSTDKDPSLWVLFAFMIFFAFIVGDGGYGAVYLGFALYMRWKWPNLKGLQKRLLNLFTLLCASCLIWGFATSSFFGLSLSIDNPLRTFSLVDWMVHKKAEYFMQEKGPLFQQWVEKAPQVESMKESVHVIRSVVSTNPKGELEFEILTLFSGQILMELALFFGGIHLLLGMARYAPRNWPLFGWILAVIGGFLYAPFYLEAPSLLNYIFHIDLKKGAEFGLQLMAIGLPLAVLLSIIKNKWLGIFEVMTLIQIFADILSYLRLYALGLAGAIVAGTINEIAASAPFLIGVLLLLIAHPVNMALGIMGGVIHGLRLNFLEWYRYSFEGNGKKFTPLEFRSFL